MNEYLIWLGLFITNFLMFIYTPVYNPSENKIRNCKVNSLIYFHELRHKEVREKYKKISSTFIGSVVWSSFIGFIISFPYKLKILWFMSATAFIIMVLIGEFDAWFFGTINYMNFKKNYKENIE